MFGLGMSCYGNLTNASMAYLPYMPYNPFGITNFGGDIQIFPVENYQQSQIGVAFNQVAQMSGWPAGMNCGYQTQPMFNPYAVISQASSMAAMSFNQMGSQEINTALQAITAEKTKIQAQLQAKDLKAEDKTKLEEKLKQLEEYEKQINAIKTSDMDPKSAYLKANELKVSALDYIKNGQTTTQGVDSAEQSSSSQNPSAPSGSSNSSGSSGSDLAVQNEPKNFTSWIDAFHDATFKPGTDNETFNACCEEITKDDVIERMIQWNQSYPEQSFMEVFMADANSSQKVKYGKHIQRALRDKAQELGIDLSKDPDYLAISKEMDSWFWIDNGVADNYNALIKKLAAKMGYQYDYKKYSVL